MQGFPDDYTLIRMSKRTRRAVEADFAEYMRRAMPGITDAEISRLAADGPRYRALGNSMATNVIRWLWRRIEMAEGTVTGRAVVTTYEGFMVEVGP